MIYIYKIVICFAIFAPVATSLCSIHTSIQTVYYTKYSKDMIGQSFCCSVCGDRQLSDRRRQLDLQYQDAPFKVRLDM